jgi:hypothetical protein
MPSKEPNDPVPENTPAYHEDDVSQVPALAQVPQFEGP